MVTALFLALVPMFLLQGGKRVLGVEEMAAAADVVGVARVVSTGTRTDEESRMIYTDARLEFLETWKGSPPPDFVLSRYGGAAGGRIASIPGEDFGLNPGETIVVFATLFKRNYYFVHGLRQGLFRVPEGLAGNAVREGAPPETAADDDIFRLPVARLREKVRAVPASPTPAAAPAVPAAPPRPSRPPAPAESPRGGQPVYILFALLAVAAILVFWRAGKKDA